MSRSRFSRRSLPAIFCLPILFASSGHCADEKPAEDIVIGWVGPLTGSAAVLGVDGAEAARLAIEEVNAAGGIAGRQAKLIVEDDQYDTSKSVTAYSRLVSAGAVAIFASTYGAPFALSDRSERDGVIVIDPLDCNDDIAALGENVFCAATGSESVGRVLVEAIRKRGQAPAIVLYDQSNPFMALVQRVFEKEGGDILGASFEAVSEAADFRTMLLSAKKTFGGKAPGAIVFLGHDVFGPGMKEARNLKIPAQFYSVGTILSPGFQKLAGEALDGTLFAFWEAPAAPRLAEFLGRFQAAAGHPPLLQLASVPTYDATMLVLQAIKQALLHGEKRPAPDAIRAGLLQVHDYQGLSGKISMDPDGAVRTIGESLYKFDKGKVERAE